MIVSTKQEAVRVEFTRRVEGGAWPELLEHGVSPGNFHDYGVVVVLWRGETDRKSYAIGGSGERPARMTADGILSAHAESRILASMRGEDDAAIWLECSEWSEPCSLASLLEANAEAPCVPEEYSSIRALSVGSSCRIGGGASGDTIVTRIPVPRGSGS